MHAGLRRKKKKQLEGELLFFLFLFFSSSDISSRGGGICLKLGPLYLSDQNPNIKLSPISNARWVGGEKERKKKERKKNQLEGELICFFVFFVFFLLLFLSFFDIQPSPGGICLKLYHYIQVIKALT